MKSHQKILEKVIAKGGLLGICAQRYIGDEQMATLYIIELSEQCHVDNLQRSFGKKLIHDILTFSTHHKQLN